MRIFSILGICMTLCSLAQGQTTKPTISLELIVHPDSKPPEVTFKVLNQGTTDLHFPSRIETTTGLWSLGPDGSVADNRNMLRSVGTAWNLPVVGPGQDGGWRLPMDAGLPYEGGTYRLYWELRGVRSKVVELVLEDGKNWGGDPVTKQFPTPYFRSPVAVVQKFYTGMDGDYGGIVRSRWAAPGNPVHLQASTLLHKRCLAAARFKEIVIRRFGPDALEPGWYFEVSHKTTLDQIQEGTLSFSEYFETGSLKPKDWDLEIKLVRDGSDWLVSLENFVRGDRVMPSLPKIVDALERTGDEIDRGMYKDIREAREVMRVRTW